MLAAALNAQRGDSNIVLLTLLGGGAFGNKEAWILDAVRRALGRASSPNLDARIVSYGASSRAVLRGKPAIANLHRATDGARMFVFKRLTSLARFDYFMIVRKRGRKGRASAT